MPMRRLKKSKHALLIMVISSVILCVIVAAAVIFFVRDIRLTQDKVIVQHLKQLAGTFGEIDRTCRIIDFDHDKNYIDFLNVKSFAGSEVGAMNLMHPDKWNGPYVEANLTVQEKPYMIVKTRQGWYITPADGVRLSNGKVIGKDLVISYETDIDSLLRDPNGLWYKGGPLAVPLKFGVRPEATQVAEELTEAENI